MEVRDYLLTPIDILLDLFVGYHEQVLQIRLKVIHLHMTAVIRDTQYIQHLLLIINRNLHYFLSLQQLIIVHHLLLYVIQDHLSIVLILHQLVLPVPTLYFIQSISIPTHEYSIILRYFYTIYHQIMFINVILH